MNDIDRLPVVTQVKISLQRATTPIYLFTLRLLTHSL